MRLSKRCEHGLKAAVQLALHDERTYLQAREIANTESLPGKFIESILSSLRAAALLESKVGARGGYRLAKPAQEIFVADLIRALESSDNDGLEVNATPGASAMANLNSRIDDALAGAVGSLTLAELMREEAVSTTTTTVRFGDTPSSTTEEQAPNDGVAASIVRTAVGGAISNNRL